MIQWVVENLAAPWAKHLFVTSPEDMRQYDLLGMVSQLTPHWQVTMQQERKGAAHAVLLALEGQDLTQPLLIANCDQYLEWGAEQFYRVAFQPEVDGLIPVFSSTHPKWSYVKLDDRGQVERVAEKEVISPWATVGIYYWKTAQLFKECAEAMMTNEKEKINGEFYVAPAYNHFIKKGGRIYPYTELTMYGLGTPEDLEEFKMAVATGRIS